MALNPLQRARQQVIHLENRFLVSTPGKITKSIIVIANVIFPLMLFIVPTLYLRNIHSSLSQNLSILTLSYGAMVTALTLRSALLTEGNRSILATILGWGILHIALGIISLPQYNILTLRKLSTTLTGIYGVFSFLTIFVLSSACSVAIQQARRDAAHHERGNLQAALAASLLTNQNEEQARHAALEKEQEALLYQPENYFTARLASIDEEREDEFFEQLEMSDEEQKAFLSEVPTFATYLREKMHIQEKFIEEFIYKLDAMEDVDFYEFMHKCTQRVTEKITEEQFRDYLKESMEDAAAVRPRKRMDVLLDDYQNPKIGQAYLLYLLFPPGKKHDEPKIK